MFERLHNPEEVLNWELGAALTMEREIVDMLDELIEESREETVKQAFRSHQAETRAHVSNLEQVFGLFGWEIDDSPCPVVKALEKEGKANIKKTDDELVDSVILGGAIETEHHEIGVYEKLIIAAQGLGRQDAVELFQRNLEDEQAALEKVKTLSRQTLASAPA